ncbi:hypothetical protein SM124_23285 [Bacillus sp. 31A1R]|uniref:Uncharacterized protein n=1 Tax=Robertmurraya mangrovi TaxID=3098077 RepID=A0ABU5J5F1_9BACI|nr:hypothetical protein [Bacillus sp. 31A1R]MDZ5474593.1 hypothetical protein [Bacillus sp. 31A1R]
MQEVRLKFDKMEYKNLEEMTTALLNEANERIIRIDVGQIKNGKEERNYAKFRLMHLQRSYDGQVDECYRSIYNSLWSQVYRLEHQGNYTNPYLKTLLERLRTVK